jgi:formylglycine-generating enzyme required for sulfatase activity
MVQRLLLRKAVGRDGPTRALSGLEAGVPEWERFFIAWYCRSANRFKNSPDYRSRHLGYRVAVVPSGK